MSRLQEIKSRIGSVKSTKKITRAMYLISASKSQKAKVQLEGTLPYFTQIATTMREILMNKSNIDTPYIGHAKATEGKGNLYVVLGSDKGMAGGYMHNIINLLDEKINKDTSSLLVAGFLGRSLIRRQGYRVDKDYRYPVMNPSVYRAREIAELVVEKYLSNQYREVHIVYTAMITPLKQEPVTAQLLPLKVEKLPETQAAPAQYNTIKYEPSAHEVFDHLVPHYLKGMIYGAFVEAFTSEQHARMYAMDNATKNADEMISSLSLRYNRARQAEITQEINEIVGGIPAE